MPDVAVPAARYESCLVYAEDLAVDELAVCVRCGWLADVHDDRHHAPVVALTIRPAEAVRRAS
jgi:hypothetical protein